MPRNTTQSDNARHLSKARLLRQMRKDAGISQKDLADKLGMSRETVSAIENAHAQSIESLSSKHQEDWWSVCAPKAEPTTLTQFVTLITSFYKL